MTEREAIKVFDGLRQAFRSLNPTEQIEAQNTLSNAHIVPSALIWGRGGFPSALGTLRAVFDLMDEWERRHPTPSPRP